MSSRHPPKASETRVARTTSEISGTRRSVERRLIAECAVMKRPLFLGQDQRGKIEEIDIHALGGVS